MCRNVGTIDKVLRTLLGLFLIRLGLFVLDGVEGNWIGIAVAVASLLPFYMVISGSCFVFKWFRTHSLSRAERARFGDPYAGWKKS